MLTLAKKPERLLGGTEDRRRAPTANAKKPRRINPYAACVVVFGHNGKMRMYLNAGVPTGRHPADGICDKCGHAYAHLTSTTDTRCRECRDDDVMMWMLDVERTHGVNLGVRCDINLDYTREQHGSTAGRRRLQMDAKEV
jgi:hypothetical protein